MAKKAQQSQFDIDSKTLNKKIDDLGKKHATWRQNVQLVLVACAKQAFDHKNVDGFTRLTTVLGGADMKAIITWAETYAPARWSKQDVAFKLNKSFKGDFDGLYLLGQAWWERATKPQNVSSTFDVLEVVRDLIKRAEKEVAAGKKTVTHAEMIFELKAIAGKEAQKAA